MKHHHPSAGPQTQNRSGPVAGPESRPLGVLVVDDDRLVRLMIQLGLEGHGFKVWLAAGGGEAIDLYKEHGRDIDVVLLDVRMPGLDGPGTLAALRDRGADVPICFMSGDLSGYEPEELFELGTGYLIDQPFKLDDLAHVLRLMAARVPADLLPAGRV